MMWRRMRRRAAMLALVGGLAPGCKFAVDHPPVAVGVAAAAIGFGTCKLASDDYAACGLVGGIAGAGLALFTAGALWLGGDGHTVLVEEQAQPLPDDGRPVRRRPAPVDPAPAPAEAVPAVPPLAPVPADPAPPAPAVLPEAR